jgi:hypothetical protein
VSSAAARFPFCRVYSRPRPRAAAEAARARTCWPWGYCTWGRWRDWVHGRAARPGNGSEGDSASSGQRQRSPARFAKCWTSRRCQSKPRTWSAPDDGIPCRLSSSSSPSSSAYRSLAAAAAVVVVVVVAAAVVVVVAVAAAVDPERETAGRCRSGTAAAYLCC